jgi:hypothetical protein
MKNPLEVLHEDKKQVVEARERDMRRASQLVRVVQTVALYGTLSAYTLGGFEYATNNEPLFGLNVAEYVEPLDLVVYTILTALLFRLSNEYHEASVANRDAAERDRLNTEIEWTGPR